MFHNRGRFFIIFSCLEALLAIYLIWVFHFKSDLKERPKCIMFRYVLQLVTLKMRGG